MNSHINILQNKTPPTDVFDEPMAISINNARLRHLASLNLDLENKTVIDIGSGVGHLAQFFVKDNCNVFCFLSVSD